jgi:hypothetical protein
MKGTGAMRKDDYIGKIREVLKNNPFILVGVSDIEGEEICNFLKKEKKEFESVKLTHESPFWEEVPEDIKEKVNEIILSGRRVISLCIKGNMPEAILSIASMWHDGDEEDRPLSPIEQLLLAIKKEVPPFYKLIGANSRGVIYAMREEAEALLKGFGARSKYKSILKDAGITDYDLEDYKQKVYDSGEAGMEKIPETYRAGIGLVIKEIRRKDRAAQGITQEQELQAERAVMKSYLIGSVTVVDMFEAKPAAVFDRLVETEKYGLLMLSSGGESYFIGPWSKVKKFEEHFSEGKVGGEPPIRGHWSGKYSRPLVLDFVESMEKVKDKKNLHEKSDLFMKL